MVGVGWTQINHCHRNEGILPQKKCLSANLTYATQSLVSVSCLFGWVWVIYWVMFIVGVGGVFGKGVWGMGGMEFFSMAVVTPEQTGILSAKCSPLKEFSANFH